jgi:hypothetical protein
MLPVARHLLAALHDPTGRDDALLAGLSDAEWADVARLAIRQRVGPLLLSRPGLAFPADVRADLRARAQRAAMRVLRQQAAFRHLADAVAPLGIQVMALKGLHLATAVYPSAGLREMGDIDLLVLPEHVEVVAETARSLGYSQILASGDSLQHLPPFHREGITLEVHYQLLSSASATPPPTSLLLVRSRPLKVAGNAVGLGPDDLIVHTCVHAAGNHLFELGLRPLCDLHAIVKKFPTQIDWATVVARAAEWRCRRSLMLMLCLARDHLGVPIPPGVFASTPGSAPSQDVLDAALSTMVSGAGELAHKSHTAAQLLHLNGPVSKVRYVVSQLFLPSATQAAASADLSKPWWIRTGHIARRAVGLARRHGGWLWRASRERNGALRQALDRRNALAEWIRER